MIWDEATLQQLVSGSRRGRLVLGTDVHVVVGPTAENQGLPAVDDEALAPPSRPNAVSTYTMSGGVLLDVSFAGDSFSFML